MEVYFASLSDYNNGHLHGAWVDLEEHTTVDEVQAEIDKMLRGSKHPNVTVTCPECDGAGCDECAHTGSVPSAEEWAAHDYDDIPSWFGECPDISDLLDYVENVFNLGDAYRVFAENMGEPVPSEGQLQDCYAGSGHTYAEWVGEFIDDTGLLDCMPEHLRPYFDEERYGRDMDLNGDVWYGADDGGICHVFWNY